VYQDGKFSPEFDHLALRVRMEDDWLADVGFGDSYVRPQLLFESGEQTQIGAAYRIEQSSNYRVILRQDDDGNWEPYYRFTPEPRTPQEFVGR
jgi:N-hydroxyarylamine O-acetyltransferase